MQIMDIPFVFDTVGAARALLGSGPEVQTLADRMSATWVQFARTGDPNNSKIPDWPAYDTRRKATMIWNDEVKVVDNPYGEEKAAIAANVGAAPVGGGRRAGGPGL
jgi:para-nitrobenzyl esterase